MFYNHLKTSSKMLFLVKYQLDIQTIDELIP
jgi:hypothetical protein